MKNKKGRKNSWKNEREGAAAAILLPWAVTSRIESGGEPFP